MSSFRKYTRLTKVGPGILLSATGMKAYPPDTFEMNNQSWVGEGEIYNNEK